MSDFAKIRRIFLPSKTLGKYAAKLYLARFLGLLIGLVTVLQLLDLLAVSDAVMAADGATYGSIVRYVSLRAPQLMSQFVPFCALLATLLTLASLSQSSEIIIMKAAGLSPHRILFPLGLPCLIIAVLHFTFNDTILSRANAELAYWEDNNYAIDLPPAPEYNNEIRMIDGDTLILAKAVTRNGNVVILDKVSIYDRESSGRLDTLTRANFATWIDGTWRLFEVQRFNPASQGFVTIDNQVWDIDISPQRFLTATVQPDYVSSLVLWRAIQQQKQEGHNTNSIMSKFLQKFTGPLSSLLMPLLGAIAGFGVHRAGSLLLRVVMGMALGFTFFVADNFMLAMGQFGVAPPLLAAGGPFLLFLTVGFAVLFFTEE